MIEALRLRLQKEYKKTPAIWGLSIDKEYSGVGRKPIKLTDEQIIFIHNLIEYELLTANTITELFGYKNGSSAFKRVMQRYDIEHSSRRLDEKRLAHRRQLTPLLEPSIGTTKGHKWITDYCDSRGWTYLEEWTGFPDNKCINPDTDKLLKFDIYIPQFNLVVEYHGRQHFSEDNWFHKSTASKGNLSQEEAYKEYIKRDAYKQRWAEDNGLQYLEISYGLYDNNYPLSAIFHAFVE